MVLVEFPVKGMNLEDFYIHSSEIHKLPNEWLVCVLFR